MSEILSKISEAIIEGNAEDMADLTEEALDDGLTAQEILDGGLMAGMDYVGVEFKAGNMFVPEVLRSGDHARIARWRRAQALARTLERRPDLIEARGGLRDEEATLLREFGLRR